MKVLNPNNTNHEIKFIPRFYQLGNVTLELKNEETKLLLTFLVTPTTLKGFMSISFSSTLKNNDNYQFKVISLSNEVIYRGKFFVTNQSESTQNYKLTKDLFRI